ncbi:MAG: hypothetical protein ACFE9L_13545 [Candidatus Hodarchaeota archaeon]
MRKRSTQIVFVLYIIKNMLTIAKEKNKILIIIALEIRAIPIIKKKIHQALKSVSIGVKREKPRYKSEKADDFDSEAISKRRADLCPNWVNEYFPLASF